MTLYDKPFSFHITFFTNPFVTIFINWLQCEGDDNWETSSLKSEDPGNYLEEGGDPYGFVTSLQATEDNLLDIMATSNKVKFKSSFKNVEGPQGLTSMDMFLDSTNPFSISERHPALAEVLKKLNQAQKSRGRKIRG